MPNYLKYKKACRREEILKRIWRMQYLMTNDINWNFDNTYSKLPEPFREIIKPVKVKNPNLILLNKSLAEYPFGPPGTSKSSSSRSFDLPPPPKPKNALFPSARLSVAAQGK